MGASFDYRQVSKEAERSLLGARREDFDFRHANAICMGRRPGRRHWRLSNLSAAALNGGPSTKRQAHELRELERSIETLQSAMFDFFLQVERADLSMSDIITEALFVWLCSFLVSCVYTMLGGYIPSSLRSLQLNIFVLLTLMCRILVKLHLLCTGRAYTSLCSLMALDQTKLKANYPKLLDFYLSPRNRTTFTLIQRVPIVPTTYLAILGWSISCFFMFQGLTDLAVRKQAVV